MTLDSRNQRQSLQEYMWQSSDECYEWLKWFSFSSVLKDALNQQPQRSLCGTLRGSKAHTYITLKPYKSVYLWLQTALFAVTSAGRIEELSAMWGHENVLNFSVLNKTNRTWVTPASSRSPECVQLLCACMYRGRPLKLGKTDTVQRQRHPSCFTLICNCCDQELQIKDCYSFLRV